MADRGVLVRDAVAAAITAGLDPDNPEAVVAAGWATTLPADLPADTPRRFVFVSCAGRRLADGGRTKATDPRDYAVRVTVVELYAPGDGDPPAPPDAWVNERVEWVDAKVYRPLSEDRRDAMADALRALGVKCQDEPDGWPNECDEAALTQEFLYWTDLYFVYRDR